MRLERLRGSLRRLGPADAGPTDGQLLGRFADGRDEAAYAALVRRHGPMVLGVCRRVLGHAQDAEDAFQATFLVLARKAASVARREAVGAFLYGVAYRTALRAREKAARRRAVEAQVDQMPHPEAAPAEAQDWRPVLDRELTRLPEKYRSAVVLCDLEGKTRREAARQLGVPEGTVASRLATGRRALAGRLARRGVALSGGALAAAVADGAAAAVPGRLAAATVRAAALVAAGRAAAAGAPAVALMNDVLRGMLMNKLKVYAGAALVAVLIGAGGVASRATGQGPAPDPAGQPAAGGARPLTELELLRREVDVLKAQVALLEEKQRARDAEVRALRGGERGAPARPGSGFAPRGGDLPAAGPNGQAPGGSPYPQSGQTWPKEHTTPSSSPPPAGARPPTADPTAPAGHGPRASGQPGSEGGLSVPPSHGGPDSTLRPTDPAAPAGAGRPRSESERTIQELEAAVSVLRAGADDAARRRALDRMERALKDLRQQGAPVNRQ